MPLLEELVQPPRGRDDHMAAVLQPLQLLALRLAAGDCAAEDTAGASKLEGLELDLPRELTRGSEHEHHRPSLYISSASKNMRKTRPKKRQGLATPALRDADEVVAGGKYRPALSLDRGRLRETGLLDFTIHKWREVRSLESLYRCWYSAAAEGADHLHIVLPSVILSVSCVFRTGAGDRQLVPLWRPEHGGLHRCPIVSCLELGLVCLPLVMLVHAPSAEVLRLDSLLPLSLTLILPIQVVVHRVVILSTSRLVATDAATIEAAGATHAGVVAGRRARRG
mmetsp:Transcript_75829/g.209265  ORF Transcript_75829/g.209265 Transcript_75829/m.209265 type:complete len:281 (-) Transcript_75829:119-961(-)